MKRVKSFLKSIFRLSLNPEKREKVVWQDLKKLHANAEWRSGIYENEKRIEVLFEISKNEAVTYFYWIYNNELHLRVKVLENFIPQLATELFIMASHFNNLLNSGVVVVNTESLYVEYHLKIEILIPLLYPDEIYNILIRHFNTSKDIFWAFQKLIDSNEDPVLIIADLLEKNKNESSNTSGK